MEEDSGEGRQVVADPKWAYIPALRPTLSTYLCPQSSSESPDSLAMAFLKVR